MPVIRNLGLHCRGWTVFSPREFYAFDNASNSAPFVASERKTFPPGKVDMIETKLTPQDMEGINWPAFGGWATYAFMKGIPIF